MEEQESLTSTVMLRSAANLTEEQWQTAVTRYKVIEPLICNTPGVTAAGLARLSGIHRVTLHKWIRIYNQSGSISALADQDNPRSTGKTRLSAKVDAVVNRIIQTKYLNKQKLSIKKTTLEIALACRKEGLQAPLYLTVRQRINQLSNVEKVARRQDISVANNRFNPLEGNFPESDYPLQAVQVDHTCLDIMVVDEICRQPIGRPWITVAIDVYSRMIIGFYISLDPPGSLGTGLCLSHAIMEKHLWLSERNIEGEWPCHGLMKSLYIGNAKEFHGKSLERACGEYDIEINFRPVKKPNYGGHIERLLGTVLREIHTLEGTTFSNPAERKHYDSEGKACFTLKELEKWLATYMTGVYHRAYHSGINMPPLAKYLEGIYGSETQIGIGTRPVITNELKLKLDFMPMVERTVQRYGVSIDGVWYYHDVLRKWVFAFEDPFSKNKVHRKFVFKRDPRDISEIYFYDPELKDYFKIPYRNSRHSAITIWEHQKIMRELKAKGMKHVHEDLIFEAYERMRDMEESASTITTVAKRLRNKTRKRYASQNSIKNEFPDPDQIVVKVPPTIDFNKVYLPFDDIEG